MKVLIMAMTLATSFTAIAAKDSCKVYSSLIHTQQEIALEAFESKGYDVVETSEEADYEVSGYSFCAQDGKYCESVATVKFKTKAGGLILAAQNSNAFGFVDMQAVEAKAFRRLPSCKKMKKFETNYEAIFAKQPKFPHY
jgi:hypothetical protein